MAAIAACLSSTAQPLVAIAVVTGPGSFTGVRIGLAAAKGLAEARNVPLLAMSRLAVLAQAVRARTAAPRVATVLDAGRSDLYLGIYDLLPGESPRPIMEAMLPRDAALATAALLPLVVHDLALVALQPVTIFVADAELHAAGASLAALAFRDGTFADTALLDANYLRVPDAEAALRARLANLPA